MVVICEAALPSCFCSCGSPLLSRALGRHDALDLSGKRVEKARGVWSLVVLRELVREISSGGWVIGYEDLA